MLALIAGQGGLPTLICQRLEERGVPFLVAEMEGHPADCAEGRDALRFRVEKLGGFFKTLARRGVTEVCFAGRVARPAIDAKALDMATIPLVPRMMRAINSGDDGVLRETLALFEEKGFAIRPVQDLLPELLPPAGVLTEAGPDDRARQDARRGEAIVAALGAADIGQACVVARGQALAIEALAGTDWMLRSLSGRGDVARAAIDNLSAALTEGLDPPRAGADGLSYPPDLPSGGILFKAPKPAQDRRVDLPAIGPQTVLLAAAAGLDGVVIEAGGVMVLERDRVLELAERLGLFLWVRPAGLAS